MRWIGHWVYLHQDLHRLMRDVLCHEVMMVRISPGEILDITPVILLLGGHVYIACH